MTEHQLAKHAWHFRKSIRPGMVMVNLLDYHVPFGGTRKTRANKGSPQWSSIPK